MNFNFIFLKHIQKNYFNELVVEDHVLHHLKEINYENKCKQRPELKTCVLFTEISEQMITEKKHLNFYHQLEQLMKQFEHIPYFYLLDSLYTNQHAFKHEKVIHCNYMLLLTYWMFLLGHNTRNTRWVNDTKKGLFLTGKIWRHNRGPLMYYFWKNKLTDKLLWSFLDSQIQYDKLKEHLISSREPVTDDSYNEFLNDCIKILDLDYKKDFIQNSPLYTSNAFPIDTSIYEKTSYSVVSETHFATVTTFDDLEYPMLSEKTYKAIINYHPFIMAGSVGVINKLESMGFKTFTNYLDIPNYNLSRESLENRYTMICDNVRTFGEKCIEFKNQIEEDVYHNAKLLEQLCEHEVQNLTNKLGTDVSILEHCIDAHKLKHYRSS